MTQRQLAPSKGELHVIVGCTDRKTQTVGDGLRLRAVRGTSLSQRFEDWQRALRDDPAPLVAAESLYSGDHWSVVRSISTNSHEGPRVTVWVASAGYGIITLSTPVKPYGATFASGHPDSVVPSDARFTSADWWRKLSQNCQTTDRLPKTVADLARTIIAGPQSFLLLALSEPYVAALAQDLVQARTILCDRLALISVGTRATQQAAALDRHLHRVPGSARLKSIVGGAMHALNARLARRAIQHAPHWYPSFSRLNDLMNAWMSQTPTLPSYDRERRNDEQFRAAILNALHEDPRMSHTRLLRMLRFAGLACEQRRFADLFREVRNEWIANDARELLSPTMMDNVRTPSE